MIVWAMGGLIVGWILSTRLRVDSLGVFLLSSVVLPLVVFAVVRRFDIDVVWGYAAFWVAVQGSYLLANLVAEKTAPKAGEGSDGGALERA
jgi:hypothetical protein